MKPGQRAPGQCAAEPEEPRRVELEPRERAVVAARFELQLGVDVVAGQRPGEPLAARRSPRTSSMPLEVARRRSVGRSAVVQLPARALGEPAAVRLHAGDARPPVGKVVRLAIRTTTRRRATRAAPARLRRAAWWKTSFSRCRADREGAARGTRSDAAAPAKRRSRQRSRRDRRARAARAARFPTWRLASRETPFASIRISPTFRRVMNVDDIPARFRSRNSIRLKCVPTATISSEPFSYASSSARSSLIPVARAIWYCDAELLRALLAGCRSVAVAVDEQLRAGAQRTVRDRVHVADDHVRLVARLEQCVRAAVDCDQHRLEVADVRPAPCAGRACNRGRARRRARAGRGSVSRAAGSRCLRRAAFPPRGGSASCSRRTPRAPRSRVRADRRARARAQARRARDRSRGTCRCGRDRRRARSAARPRARGRTDPAPSASISRTPPRTSASGPGFGKRPDWDGDDVDDDAHAGLDELLRRDAVDVGVVDDRDVVRRQALHEILRAAVELGVAGELDEAHSTDARQELATAEHPLQLVAPLRVVELLRCACA